MTPQQQVLKMQKHMVYFITGDLLRNVYLVKEYTSDNPSIIVSKNGIIYYIPKTSILYLATEED